MKRVLADIQAGRFVQNFMLDNRAGQTALKASAQSPPRTRRAGRRQAARDDAVDQAAHAGGQEQELIGVQPLK